MAKTQVSLSYQFADGSAVGATVVIGNDYPDALAEAQARAVDLMREAAAIGVAAERASAEGDGA